jgi:hypothetical protein
LGEEEQEEIKQQQQLLYDVEEVRYVLAYNVTEL